MSLIKEWIQSVGEKCALPLLILAFFPYAVIAQSTTDTSRVDPLSSQQDQLSPNILGQLRTDQSSSSSQDQLSTEETLQLLQRQQQQGVSITNTHSAIEGRSEQNAPN